MTASAGAPYRVVTLVVLSNKLYPNTREAGDPSEIICQEGMSTRGQWSFLTLVLGTMRVGVDVYRLKVASRESCITRNGIKFPRGCGRRGARSSEAIGASQHTPRHTYRICTLLTASSLPHIRPHAVASVTMSNLESEQDHPIQDPAHSRIPVPAQSTLISRPAHRPRLIR